MKLREYLMNENYDVAVLTQVKGVGPTNKSVYTVNYKIHNFTFEADNRIQALGIAQDYINDLSYTNIRVLWRDTL